MSDKECIPCQEGCHEDCDVLAKELSERRPCACECWEDDDE